jgi:hypothetical protein
MTKTVIIIWKQHVINDKDSFWGFGDMLRGVCGVFDVCEALGYKLYIDMRHHPVHNFFQHIENGYESIIDTNINNIIIDTFNTRISIIDKLHSIFETSDVYYNAMWCHTYILDHVLSSSMKDFIGRLLTPTIDFRLYIDSMIPSESYNVLHFRLGDNHIASSTLTGYEQYVHLIERYARNGDVIISDNKRLKEIIRDIFHDKYKITNIEPCHIGTETDLEKIRGTLYEFILTSRAKHISTKTCYGWTSGFVHTIHRIFDVPMTCIR